MGSEIDWEIINSKLPFQRNPEAKAKRRELFKKFDPNGNKYLSLAEVDKGMRDVLNIDELFDCKAAVNRAFHSAKNASQKDDKYGPEYLEFREFRLFLQNLRQFFEYYQAFDRIDTGDDNRVSKEEFCSDKIKASVETWVGKIDDMEAEFSSIDANGGGQILFNEFVIWALKKNLDIEDDIDSQDE
ncbi:flagellar calcium-binding protein [Lepeophtheirus salmonis]|uniref:Flagellar calcium-binding protein n=1 Tax=Lepeophtheirus salmonis TaxID=72036 RepID=C1BSG0_LEPSM|nr:flagellar calcium-binding protein-like [Lepeophtheirus salmonis]XP_040580833.1 flagellar calcium-binding protein-like [Lepeophtheirus salmonis]ACO11963.1 Flagellar calcium-binding protein [Lepeophtheirus salmonis]ACO12590.1 Flagellar calcium-binding protein [Lepeophtheirus salmonis]